MKTIEGHRLSYYDPDDGVRSTFGEKSAKGYLGVWPTPQYTPLEAAETIVENLAEFAVTEMSKVATLIVEANGMYEAVSQDFDENTSDGLGNDINYEWPYGGSWFSDKQSDINQYNEIDYEQPYGSNQTFYAKSEMYDGNVNPALTWEVEIEAPESSSSSSSLLTSMSTGGPGNRPEFPDAVKHRFGLRKVPISKLERAGIGVIDPLVVDGDKTWWASKPQGQIKLVPETESPI